MEVGLVVLWVALFLLLGFVALPLSAWLFAGLDAGALAIPLALGVLAVVGYLVGHVAFGLPAALAGVVVLGGLSALASRRLDEQPDPRSLGEGAVVFTVAFLFVVAIRAVDPAAAPLPLAIGEKFLDFGLVASLDRTAVLPPEDMWFAGESVRYYYGGHMTAVLLGELANTAPRYIYNLGLAGFYATLVTGAYGLASSIASPYDVSRRVAGTFAAFLVGIAGNLEPAARLAAWLLPDDLVASLAPRLGLDASVASWTPADFWYFSASRVIPVNPGAEKTYMAATEFPLFSWLNGDLHAHMMSQSFMLVVAALLLAYWRTPAEQWRRRLLLLCGAVPPVVGIVGVTNVWSFPTAGALAALAVLFAPGEPTRLLGGSERLDGLLAPRDGPVEELRRVGLAAAAFVVVMVLAVVWTLPFWTSVIPGGPGKSPALWGSRTPLGNLLLIHGAFLAVFVPYLARRFGAEGRQWTFLAGAGLFVAVALFGFPALALAGPIGLAAWWLLRTRTDVGYEAMLVLAGAGLLVLVELVTIEGERFNVIFKTYSDIWLFWSVAGGVALARLAAAWPATTVDVSEERRQRWRRTGATLAVAVVLVTSLYAGLALPKHFQKASPTAEAEGPTLDATAYLEVEYPAEAPAIRWLNAREGQPTIVTAAPGGYRWKPSEGKGASAPASLTGLPTVLGWFHEAQYRGQKPYQRRLDDVKTIYTGEAANQSALLAKYDVTYVYVGPAERAKYGTITVDERPWTRVAKQWEKVTIYRVNRTALGD